MTALIRWLVRRVSGASRRLLVLVSASHTPPLPPVAGQRPVRVTSLMSPRDYLVQQTQVTVRVAVVAETRFNRPFPSVHGPSRRVSTRPLVATGRRRSDAVASWNERLQVPAVVVKVIIGIVVGSPSARLSAPRFGRNCLLWRRDASRRFD